MNPPLSLELRAPRSPLVVGQAVVLELAHRVTRECGMETVELNRDRTRIRVQVLGPRGHGYELTGADHIRARRLHPLAGVGREFNAPAGSEWVSNLNLSDFAPPLPAGSYRFSVVYRYGQDREESVVTGEVDVEIAEARLLDLDWRWFGVASARDELASVASLLDGARARSLYQIAPAGTPEMPTTSVELAPDARVSEQGWRVGQLDDAAGAHAFRRLVAVSGTELRVQSVGLEGRFGAVRSVATGLRTGAVLARPPLQREDDGLRAVAVGFSPENEPAAGLVEIPPDGASSTRLLPLRHAPGARLVVSWGPGGALASSWLWGVGPHGRELLRVRLDGGNEIVSTIDGEILDIAEEQWLGAGRVVVLVHTAPFLRVLSYDLSSPESDPEEVGRHDLAAAGIAPPFLPATCLSPYLGGGAILARTERRSVLFAPGPTTRWIDEEPGRALVGLVSSPTSLYLLRHSPTTGLEWTAIEDSSGR